MGPEQIWLRFWAMFVGQVQNDLKWLWKRLLDSDLTFLKNVKNGSRKNWLRFWEILGCQVQNDLKTLGNRFWGRDLNFFPKDVKNGSGKNLVTLLGRFGMSGAE